MKRAEQLLVQTGKASDRMSKQIASALSSSNGKTQQLGQRLKALSDAMRGQYAGIDKAQSAAQEYFPEMQELVAAQTPQQAQIEETKKKIADLNAEYKRLSKSGAGDDRLGAMKSSIAAWRDTLSAQQDRLSSMRSEFAGAAEGFDTAASFAERLQGELAETRQEAEGVSRALSFRAVGEKIGGALKSMSGIGALKSLAGHFRDSASAGSSLSNVAGKVGSKLFSIGNIIKGKLVSLAVGAVFQNLGKSMDSLARHSSSVNNAMSKLKQGAMGISGSLASAFAPVLSSVQPVLSGLISMVTNAINAVNQFFAKLSGASSWKKAVPALSSYAGAAGDVGGAADKAAGSVEALKRSVMGFDQLNKLDDSSSGGSGGSGGGGGGGGGGSGSGGDGITWVDMPIDNAISEFAEKFKEAWENADFTEIGRIVGEKLKGALESIPWDAVKAQCNKVAKSVATFLNGFFETPGLFEVVGQTIGEGLNTAFETVHTFMSNLHFDSIGKALTTALQSAFVTFDWGNVTTFLSDRLIASLDLITGAIQGIDWSALPGQIRDALVEAVKGINFSGISESFGKLFGAAIKAGIDLIGGIGNLISEGFFAATKQPLPGSV